jgi:hypothetical protein
MRQMQVQKLEQRQMRQRLGLGLERQQVLERLEQLLLPFYRKRTKQQQR